MNPETLERPARGSRGIRGPSASAVDIPDDAAHANAACENTAISAQALPAPTVETADDRSAPKPRAETARLGRTMWTRERTPSPGVGNPSMRLDYPVRI